MAYIGNSPDAIQNSIEITRFNGTSACTQFQIPQDVDDAKAIEVLVNSVQQDPDNSYSVVNGLITFTEAPSTGTNNITVLRRTGLTYTRTQIESGDIFANAVTGPKLADGAVTGPKIGLTAINANNIVDGTITGAKIALGTITGDDIAPNQITGNLLTNNSISSNNLVDSITIANTTTSSIANFLGPIFEKANVVTTGGLTATVTINVSSSSVLLYTANSAANATINFTGLGTAMAVGNVATYAVMVPNSTTPKYISAVEIDGNAITPKWSGGTPSTGTSANTDMYTFSIFKTSATPTYNVFAQVSSFF
jgi:hypothetical protein